MSQKSALTSRWLRDDAFRLQLGEVDGIYDLFQSVPNPAAARAWFVALCLYRFSDQARRLIRTIATNPKIVPVTSPLRGFMFSVMLGIEDSPEYYPFFLSEREFAYYATESFGHTIPDAEGIYHPPSFYGALAQDILAGIGGVFIGVFAAEAIPAEIAGAGVIGAFAPKVVSGAIGAAGGSIVGHFMPGGSFAAAKADTLWPRYEADYKRRLLK